MLTTETNFQITSEQDELLIDLLTVVPKGIQPKAVLQISHGMCEHKERYLEFMRYLAGLGYISVINDHRGHGKSVKSDEDLGYFYPAGGQGLVEDLHQITLFIKEKYPELPIFLFGHSMGSLAVRAYIKDYDADINGLIVCGCPSENPGLELGIKIIDFFIKKKGEKARVDLITRMVVGEFDMKFLHERTPNAWICSNKKVVDAYNADPLCNFTFTLNGYKALLYLMSTVYIKEGWKVNNSDLPIRFISGSDDPCLINQKKFTDAVNFLKYSGYKTVSYRLFEGMRHEILNETDKQIVFEDIAETLESAMKAL